MFLLVGTLDIFFTRWVVELNQWFVPKVMYQPLEKLGLGKPKLIRVCGYIAVFLGLLFACASVLFPLDRGSGTVRSGAKYTEKKSDKAG